MTDAPGTSPQTSSDLEALPAAADLSGSLAPEQLAPDAEDFDPLSPSDNLRRRQWLSRVAGASQTVAALLAVALLGGLVLSVFVHAASVLSLGFLTSAPPRAGQAVASGGVLSSAATPGGGVAPEIIGTAVIVAIGALIATPMGILIALYLTEFAGSGSKSAFRLAIDLLNGLPTIIVDLFVFGLLVVGHGESGFAGAFALAIIMLPLITRGTQEVLLLVPSSLREAADALGVSHWRTVLGVILPSARGGMLTATVLAVARAAGETAPLILVCSIYNASVVSVNPFGHEALPNIPTYIFSASEAAESSGFARAWGAAFVLLAFILLSNIAGRALASRNSIVSR